MSDAGARTATLPPSPTLGGSFAALSESVAKLFEVTAPSDRDRLGHRVLLFVLLCSGAIVRFWGLGNVGLHGDEETMAMAVRGIVETGSPILPSGMFYPRGMTQLYLMALSVASFGESEWALRLPSVLCGIALIALTYFAGRRFLRPAWSLAAAATVAFLPDLITDSQTARMYIFMVTAIMASTVCLFAWERTDRLGWLIAASLLLVIGMDMHLLSIAVVPTFLIPGLLQASARKLSFGAAAAAAVGVAFLLIDALTNAQYPVPPPEFAAALGLPPPGRVRSTQEFSTAFHLVLGIGGLAIVVLAWHVSRALAGRIAVVASAASFVVAVSLQLMLFYHLAALFYLSGAVVAFRYGPPRIGLRVIPLALAVSALALVHGALLASIPGQFIKLVGSMMGQPSVWPYVRVVQLCVAAGVLTFALLGWGIYLLARKRPLPDYWLLAALGVWAPLFALGLFAWNVPARYTEMSLAPMLLAAFAFAQRASEWLNAKLSSVLATRKVRDTIVAALIALAAINPVQAARAVNVGYSAHPDHKGAAEFMRTQQISADDLVLAEDVLQQTYYLGRVDYWLIGGHTARRFVKRAGNGVVDFYTGTPVIATRAMLEDLMQKNPGKRMFIIGSGEQQSDGRRHARGAELHELLESDRFETVYFGRDRLTRVLRPVPGAVQPSMSTSRRAAKDSRALAIEAQSSAEKQSGTAAPSQE